MRSPIHIGLVMLPASSVMRRKSPLPFGVDPQVTGGAAAIALPARGIGRVAADHRRLAGAERQVIDLSERQQLRHAACRHRSVNAR